MTAGPIWEPTWDEAEVRRVLATMEGFFDGDEPVDELSHALQSATLALEGDASPELLAAAFLHDVGRSPAVAPLFPRLQHEQAGAEWLAPRTSDKVAWLVRAHVPAKVFLVEHDPAYLATLSHESVLSLGRQKAAAVLDPDDRGAGGSAEGGLESGAGRGSESRAASGAASGAGSGARSGERNGLERWAANPWWPEALQLRRWDDAAKVPGAPVADLGTIFAVLRPAFSA